MPSESQTTPEQEEMIKEWAELETYQTGCPNKDKPQTTKLDIGFTLLCILLGFLFGWPIGIHEGYQAAKEICHLGKIP